MYPNLIQAPSEEPLFIARIDNPKLAAQLRKLGIGEDAEVIKENRQVLLKPALIEGKKGSLILSAAMTAEIILEREDDRLVSLAEIHSAESGTFKGCIDGGDLMPVLNIVGLCVGDEISFVRAVPALELIAVLNSEKQVRFTLDRAARIWGMLEKYSIQFAATRLNQKFKVTAIPEKTKAEPLIRPGDMLELKALEAAASSVKNQPKAVVFYIGDKLKLFLPEQSAAQIFVRVCDICWSCGECQVKAVQ